MVVDHLPSGEDGGRSTRPVPLIAPGMHRPSSDADHDAARQKPINNKSML
jgi:hypothetical protein